MQHLLHEVTNPTRAKTYDELTALITVWERNLKELEKFPDARLSSQQKMMYLRKMMPEQLEENILAQVNGFKTYETLIHYVESQIALRRTGAGKSKAASSAGQGLKTKDPDKMDIGSFEEGMQGFQEQHNNHWRGRLPGQQWSPCFRRVRWWQGKR